MVRAPCEDWADDLSAVVLDGEKPLHGAHAKPALAEVGVTVEQLPPNRYAFV